MTPRAGRARTLPPVVRALVLGAGVFALGLGAVLLAPAGSHVAAWWPAAGVGVSGLVVWGRRPHLVLVVLVASAAANLAGGRPLPVALAFRVANALEAATASWWLTQGAAAGRARLLTTTDLWRLVVAAVLGAAVAATVVGAVVWADGGPVWTSWRSVVAAHAAGVLLLVPLALPRPPSPDSRGRAEALGQWAAVLVVPGLVFSPGQHLPLAFLVLPPLLWAASRSGVTRVARQLAVVFVLVTLCTADGSGPFTALADPQTVGLLVQVLTASTCCVALAMALSVAEHRAALQALAERKEFDDAVLEAVGIGVFAACDATGRVVVRNRAHRLLTGVDDERVEVDELAERLVLLDDTGRALPRDRWPLRRVLAGESFTDELLRFGPVGTPDDDLPRVRSSGRVIRSADGTHLGAVVCLTDVTEEHRVHAELRAGAAFHDAVLTATPDIVFVTDVRTSGTVWTSRTFVDLLGYTGEQVRELGEGLIAALVHPEDVPRVRAANTAVQGIEDGGVLQIRYRVRHSDGEFRTLSRRITPFARDDDGAVTQVLGVARDVTDAVEAEQRLAEAALHDPLTALPNRRLLADRLRLALARTARTGSEVAVLFCDLDGFKQVNDTGGHAAGDAVLVETAVRLRDALRPQDTVARVGGDEFVVLVECDDPAGAVEAASAVARRLTEAVGVPVDVDGEAFRVTVSIGVTFGRAGDDADAVLHGADSAMYRAKAAGKDRHVVAARG